MTISNRAEPVVLQDVKIDGVAAEAKPAGAETAAIWQNLAMTSDHPAFHGVAEGLSRVLDGKLNDVGSKGVSQSNSALVVIGQDDTARVWLDTAAVTIEMLALRDMDAGSAVYEADIADVHRMDFPDVTFLPTDRVLYLFRDRWRFGLYFDLTRQFSLDACQTQLGALYRNLRYKDLLDLVSGPHFDRLVRAGWFPFAAIMGDLKTLVDACTNGFGFDDAEQELIVRFTTERTDALLARWLMKPHLASREVILREALEAWTANRPVAVVKIILTELEGVLRDAHRAATGKSAKLETLLEFAADSAVRKSGGVETLMLPTAFRQYLKTHTFANFDPDQDDGQAGSRHAVGHGAAASATYTRARALQALLTLDQLAFYT